MCGSRWMTQARHSCCGPNTEPHSGQRQDSTRRRLRRSDQMSNGTITAVAPTTTTRICVQSGMTWSSGTNVAHYWRRASDARYATETETRRPVHVSCWPVRLSHTWGQSCAARFVIIINRQIPSGIVAVPSPTELDNSYVVSWRRLPGSLDYHKRKHLGVARLDDCRPIGPVSANCP